MILNFKLYGIEWKDAYHGTEYRWYSKYNSARGGWTSENAAIKGGEEHELIIREIYDLLPRKENVK
jgi:hypothetical protein